MFRAPFDTTDGFQSVVVVCIDKIELKHKKSCTQINEIFKNSPERGH